MFITCHQVTLGQLDNSRQSRLQIDTYPPESHLMNLNLFGVSHNIVESETVLSRIDLGQVPVRPTNSKHFLRQPQIQAQKRRPVHAALGKWLFKHASHTFRFGTSIFVKKPLSDLGNNFALTRGPFDLFGGLGTFVRSTWFPLPHQANRWLLPLQPKVLGISWIADCAFCLLLIRNCHRSKSSLTMWLPL